MNGTEPKEERIRNAAAGWIARLERGASPRLYRKLDRWRAADPRHDAAYQRMAQQFEGARILRGSGKYAVRTQAVRRPAQVTWVVAGLCAATLALLLFLLPQVWSFRPGVRTGELGAVAVEDRAAFRRDINASAAAVSAVGLGDGSVVTCDAGSTIQVRFTPAVRSIKLLNGRARFYVAHDGRPFTVFAGGGSVTARGTVFDVSLGSDGRVGVALLRGIVDVAPAARPWSGSGPTVRRLDAGEGVAFGAGALLPRSRAAAPASHWADAATDFDGVSLGYLIELASHSDGPSIRTSDPALARLRVSGRFGLADHDRLATHLAALLSLRIDRTSDAIVLTR